LLIFHIAGKAEWQPAVESGVYEPPSLATEGFIHCSTVDQVVESANRFFRGRQDLVLLSIDTERLKGAVRFEKPANPEDARRRKLFPHIYGPLSLSAVIQTLDFPCDNQTFRLPEGLLTEIP
jgi:uncharacterized protein (DUF952 family)